MEQPQPPKKEPRSTPDPRQSQMANAFRNLQHCVHHCEQAVFFTDAAGILQRVNPAFERLTGYPSTESVGKDLSWMAADGPASDTYKRIWQDIFENRAFRGTLEVRRRDGNCLEMELTAIPVRDSKGHITSLVCTGRDLREEQAAEVKLSEARKLNAIATLARAVAHDLNNTLMIISGCSEVALEGLPREDRLWGKLQEIKSASQRASELASELLAFGRRGLETHELVSLNAVVQETCRILPRVVGRDIQLQVVLGDETGLVDVNVGQLQQILLNLAINARDALLEGGRFILETYSVDTKQNENGSRHGGHCATLAVSVAKPAKSAERAPVISVDTDALNGARWIRESELSMIEQAAKDNQGYISVDGNKGGSTVVQIYFPIAELKAEPTAEEAHADASETLLLVEDEAVIRTAAAEFLSGAGYQVLAVNNGQEGFEKILGHPGKIDLLITDIIMPQMSGPKLAEAAMAIRPDTKILFLSGYADNPALKKLGGSSAQNFLLKPFSLRTLRTKIREILDEAPARARAAAGGVN